jgi:hypothetical protein
MLKAVSVAGQTVDGGGYGEWARVLDLLADKKCHFDIAFTLEEMIASNDAMELIMLVFSPFTDTLSLVLFPGKDSKVLIGNFRVFPECCAGPPFRVPEGEG